MAFLVAALVAAVATVAALLTHPVHVLVVALIFGSAWAVPRRAASRGRRLGV